MTLAARIIHYLLIIAIDLLPMAGISAADTEHEAGFRSYLAFLIYRPSAV